MAKYLFVYHGGKKPESDEEYTQVMDAWGAWFGTMGATMAGLIPLWMAFLVGSITIYLNYTVMHEAVHGSICPLTSAGWQVCG